MNITSKNILYAIGLTGFLVLVGWGIINKDKTATPNLEATASGVLQATENDYDFGTISMKNGKVSRIFEIKNTSPEPVTIEKVYTSCMCTQAVITDNSNKTLGTFSMPGHGGGSSKANISVNAGESIKVEAIFDPAAHGPSGVGVANRTVYLENNSKESPKIELNFKAVVTQ